MSCENNCGPLVVTLLTGAPGIQGEQGVQGPEGPVGPQGPQGPAGGVGSITGDISISTDSVASLVTVGVAAITGSAAQALTLQTDAKGRVLAVTAQAISVTTSQVQNLSLATLGGVATTDARLSDSRTPSGAAGGDLAGTYPNPTLGAVGTAGVTGAADKTLILQMDTKGRAVAVTAQAISVTTSQVQNLSLSTLGGVATTDPRLSDSRVPTGSAGGDLTGTYPNPTLGNVTTAKSDVGSATHVPLVSVDAKGRVTSLTSVQISALTTAQLSGLSTSTPAALATSGAVGTSLFAARADHVHALQTLGEPGTWGSGTIVPVLTVDAFGRVASVTTAEITGTGGAALSTQAPLGLATAGVAGTGTEAAAWDHRHPVSGDVGIGESETLKVQGALGYPFAPTHESILTDYALVFQGTEWIQRVLKPSDEMPQALGVAAPGNAAEFARADHVHENPCPDASNAQPENIGTASPGTSADYSRADHVHALTTTIEAGTFGGSNGIPVLTVDEFGRLTSITTEAVANFSTLPALGLTTAGVVGMSGFAAQADHQHPITGDVTLFDPFNGTDVQVVGLRANPLAMMAPQQDQVLTFDAGEWCPKDPQAGVTLSDANPAALGATAAPGTSADASRADHVHAVSGDVAAQNDGTLKVTALQTHGVADVAPSTGQVLTWTGSAWVPGAPAQGGSGGGGIAYFLNAAQAGASPVTNLPGEPKALGRASESLQSVVTSGTLSQVDYTLVRGFVTAVGDPGVTTIPAGIWDFNLWASSNANSANQTILQARLYKYDASNALTLLATSDDVSVYDPSVTAQYILALTVPQTTVLATDRLYIELLGKATANNRTVTLSFGASTPTHVHTTLPSVSGTGLAKVINSIFQTPASLLINADVDAAAGIAQSKIANLTTDLGNKLNKFTRTAVVGQDAATVQGCIDLFSDATYTNPAQVLVPPGLYTENITFRGCVLVSAIGHNNGQTSTVRITGTHAFTGGATAANNQLQVCGIRLTVNNPSTPTLSLASATGVSSVVHLQDCVVENVSSNTSSVGVLIGPDVSVKATNLRSNAYAVAGSGGTHFDINGGSLYADGLNTEFGTCVVLMRGTNGALKPYAEIRNSLLACTGANVISITSTTALFTAGFTAFSNLAATGNGINIAGAGSVVGVYQSSFAIQPGATNYVVTGVAGTYYYSLGNNYSNATGISYETKVGASVAQFQYSRSYDPASGDLTGSFPAPTLAAITTAQSNVGSATVVPKLSIDAKGRVTALTTVQISALTTAQLSGLSTAIPAALTTAGVIGSSLFAAKADHAHALATLGAAGTFGSSSVVPVLTVDAFGRVASVTTAGIIGGGGGISALSGDVVASGSGSVTASVQALRGYSIATTAPVDLAQLTYSASENKWLTDRGTFLAEVLLIAGGAGGGRSNSGGGGAGGVYYGTFVVLPGANYTISIGAGGAGSTVNGTQGTSGGNSLISFSAPVATAIGGGGGGAGNITSGPAAGVSGGSGGGAGYGSGGGTYAGGAGTSGQGNAGGSVNSTSSGGPGAGGGGAGAAGASVSGSSSVAGNGGAGTNTYSTWATATSTGASGYYGGGGGGGVNAGGTAGTGGAGGGGAGGLQGTPAATAGTANTGGGGGGAGGSFSGANGGSGLAIIRYTGAARCTGGTIVTTGGYTYHTFTTSGNLIA